jgi:Rps23 Pro-64 3,4-dihydroxylase Tpa1-like proline 4-hydroxylase
VLHPSVLQNLENLRSQFATAQPFRHVVIDSFLDPTFCKQLTESFPSFDPNRAKNEYGEQGRKAVIPNIAKIGPAYARFDAMMRDPEFLSQVGRITGIPELLYDPDYIGGGTHENLDGQELDSHVDFNFHPRKWTHRRLNLIVFLNEKWEEDWGGCLELLRDPSARDTDRSIVIPLKNRAVIFETTESSWHGFPRIELPPDAHTSRRSIAVYFYTKDRPEEQTAPQHGTVYYQRPLPGHIEAGRTLTEDDAAQIRDLLARRDRHIRFLHERELEISKVLTGITRSPSFLLGRALTWPGRRLRSLVRK